VLLFLDMRNMKRVALVSLFFMFLGLHAGAQDTSRVDTFIGYSYVNADFNGIISRQSFNGWEASAAIHATRTFGFEGDAGGYYKTINGVSVTDYVFAGGPRIDVRPVFVHALVGMDHLSSSFSSLSGSQNGLAAAFGGGLQQRITGHWAMRVSGDYLLTRHSILGGARQTQNNLRLAAGVVYGFGGIGRSEPKAAQSPNLGIPIASLGIRVIPADSRGAQVTEVGVGSLGEQAHLRVGDVINKVDGKPITTPTELAAELATRSKGAAVTIGYLVRGLWQTEAAITLR
jgi:hypothetical protein